MRGPGVDLDHIDHSMPLDAGFRLIVAYQYTDDALVTRIDIKILDRQYCVAFASGTPIAPKERTKFDPKEDMITPSSGVIDCLNIKAPIPEILRALKELVADLEQDQKLGANWKTNPPSTEEIVEAAHEMGVR